MTLAPVVLVSKVANFKTFENYLRDAGEDQFTV